MGTSTAPSASPLAATTDDTDRTAITESATDDLLNDELLLEEISIDGMCGVY